ncbi:MAG: glycosyltransferase family 39 protein [Chloroflexi bacterium]|nr:glycosyltransferase family 39 protein [Chloroflexota bacterium]
MLGPIVKNPGVQQEVLPLGSLPLLAFILLLGLAIYVPTLGQWFTGDDFWFLRSSQATPFWEYAGKAFDFRETGALPEFDRYRPLYPVVWKLQYEVFGLNSTGYHVVLLVLHLACITVVYLISRRLFKLEWAALLAALIFAVHPAFAEAVGPLWAGNRVFATLPYLLSILFFIRYAGSSGRAVSYSASILFFVIAMLTHSTAITLVAVLPAYAFLLGGRPRDALRPTAWLPFAPFVLTAAVMIGIQVWVRTNLGVEEQFRFGWHQYSLYGRYFGAALFPILVLDMEAWPVGIRAVLNVIEGLASLGVIVTGIFVATQHRRSLIGVFAVFWLLVALLPDSTLLFPISGRALYLPGPAFAILFVAAIVLLKGAVPERHLSRARLVAFTALFLCLAGAIALTVHATSSGQTASTNRAFVNDLTDSIPELEPNSTLYVVGAPLNLVVFDDSRLIALVDLYYDQVEVRRIGLQEAAQVELTLAEGDRIFRYER